MSKWNLVRDFGRGEVVAKVDGSYEKAGKVKNELEQEYGWKIVIYEAM